MTEAVTILFVINPISGNISKDEYVKLIEKELKTESNHLHFFYLTGKNDVSALQFHIEKIKPQTIVAVGGDGTVSLVAKMVAETSMQMGIIPSGSANGMALELNIPISLLEAISVIKKGKAGMIDIIKINNQICIHLSDIGINAQLIKYFEKGKTRGKIGYAKVAFRVLFRMKALRVSIQTDATTILRHAYMVVIANASKYGTGAVINPRGDLSDGYFEIVILRKLSLSTLFKMWFRPHAFTIDQIEIYKVKSAIIQTEKKVHFQIDGEFLGKVQNVNANIIPGKLKMLMPEGT